MGQVTVYSMFALFLLVTSSTGSPQPRLSDTPDHWQHSVWSKLRNAMTCVYEMLQSFWYTSEEVDFSATGQKNFTKKGSGSWATGGGKESFSSWPAEPVLEKKYEGKGRLLMLDESMQAYQTGSGSKMVVWSHDIFGLTGANSDKGRTKEWADYLAENGYNVLVPDWFRGNNMPGGWFGPDTPAWLAARSIWTNILADWETVIYPFLEEQSPSSIGLIGTCWGSYPVVRLSTLNTVSAGVSMHPSHPNLMRTAGEDEKQVLGGIKSQQLFLLEGDAGDSLKAGGVSGKVLGDKLTVVEFPDMEHGWTVRGDLENPVIARDVQKAKELVLDFLGKYLN